MPFGIRSSIMWACSIVLDLESQCIVASNMITTKKDSKYDPNQRGSCGASAYSVD